MRFRAWPLRARLTALYGGIFGVAGLALLLAMNVLVARRLEPSAVAVLRTVQAQGGAEPPDPGLPGPADVQQALDTYNDGTVHSMLRWSLVALVVILVVAAAVGWLVAGRALRPLAEITATARRVADRNLHERIALQGPPDELKDLADTFDAMLERLDAAFAGQRRFVANASHELRTPLAVTRTVLEVALGDPTVSDDVRRLGGTLLVTNARSEHLIDGLLTLAGGSSEPLAADPVDLAEVAGQAVEACSAEAAAAGIAIRTSLAPLVVRGDGVLLERLVLNLVQNGIRHNTGAGWVSVTTAPGTGLVVENTGPAVAPYELEVIFEPFRRLRAERTGSGTGLGLSIVRSVARAHGGDVVATARPEGGLVQRLVLRELDR